MALNKQKSYGEGYTQSKFKIKINKRKLFYFIFILLCLSEIVLGVLWVLGF